VGDGAALLGAGAVEGLAVAGPLEGAEDWAGLPHAPATAIASIHATRDLRIGGC
jgi:hypothetical protein